MPILDLSQFGNDISKNVQQADISTDPNAAIYRSLSAFGETVGAIGQDLYAKQRKQEVANDAYEDYRVLREKSEQFDTEWSNKLKEGTFEIDGKGYETAKKEFLVSYTGQIKAKHSKDIAKYETFKDISKDYVTNSMVNSITEANKQRLEGTVFNNNKKTKEFVDRVSLYNGDDVMKLISLEGKPLVDQIYNTTEPFNSKLANESKRKFTRDTGLMVVERTKTEVYNGGDASKLFGSFVPIDFVFDKEKMGYQAQFLNDEYQTPDDILAARDALLKNWNNSLEAMKQKAYADGSLPKEMIASIEAKQAKLQEASGNGAINLDGLFIEGVAFTEEEKILSQKLSSSNDNTMFFKELTTSEQQNYIQDILKLQMKGKKVNASTVQSMLNNIYGSIVGTLDKSKFKDRPALIAHSYTRLNEMYNDPAMRATKDDYDWANEFKKMGMAQATHSMLSNRVAFFSNDPRYVEKKMREEGERYILESMGPAGLDIVKNHPTIGGADMANWEQKMLSQYYSMRKQIMRDGGPQNTAMVYDPSLAKGLFDKNGVPSQSGILKLNAASDEIKIRYGAIGADKGETITSAITKEIDANITRKRISGDNIPKYYSMVLKSMTPDFAGLTVDSLVKQGKITQTEADTMLMGHLGGLNADPAYMAEIATLEKATRPEEVKRVNEILLGQLGKDSASAIQAKVNGQIEEFVPKGTMNLNYLQSTRNALTALVKSEYAKDPTRKLDTVVEQVTKRFVGDRVISVSSDRVKGVFKKASSDETTSNITTKATNIVSNFQSKILNGGVEINMEPFSEFTEKSKGIFNSKEKAKAFVNSYSIEAVPNNVAGGDRVINFVARDSSGKIRYLADKKGNLYSEVIP